MADFPDSPLRLHLRDGTPVIARPLVSADRAGLVEAYRRLSPEARYHRFWTRTGEMIGDKMLDRLLVSDPGNHACWVILDRSREFPGLGAASWWRNRENREEAEISATVLDGDQGRGIGTLVLALMWVTALRAGIKRLVAYALIENSRAATWMRASGADAEWDGYKLVFRWELENLDALPDTRVAADLASWLALLSPKLLREIASGETPGFSGA